MTTSTGVGPLSDDWCAEHFDYLDPELARTLHPTLARMREVCPVTHSDQRGGYWALTRYEDVLHAAQDWETFSSALGIGIPHTNMVTPAIPEHIDPPLQRVYKKLISAHFTPAVVREYEGSTRDHITTLIDEFIERGSCDFMTEFAQPFPGLAFFDLVLNAPADQVRLVNDLATRASVLSNADSREVWQALNEWIATFLADRRDQPPKGDVVDAILTADIDGRPITETEVFGMVLLLLLGGLETTAGALGHIMLRFVREPEIPALLKAQPQLIPAAVEELLRLETSFIAIGRTARSDVAIEGHDIKAGEKVLLSWASANRDETEFPQPDSFDLNRSSNRHLAFGAGPHRCVGSTLARLNLRLAVHEIVQRLADVQLTEPEESLPFHSAFNRSPLSIPITFRPGARLGVLATAP